MTKDDYIMDEGTLQALADAITKIVNIIAEMLNCFVEHAAPAFDNKRVVHLARYGSTQRIREKNRRRLIKIVKEAKK